MKAYNSSTYHECPFCAEPSKVVPHTPKPVASFPPYESQLPKSSSDTPMPEIKPAKVEERLSRYHRMVKTIEVNTPSGETVHCIDVYAALKAFDVKDQAIGHAIKKLLDGGNRGVKSQKQDWEEAIMSIQAAIKLQEF